MPTKPIKQITAGSISRLKTYENCALKAKLQILEKIKEPDSEAMANGTYVHALAQGWSTGAKSVDIMGPDFKTVIRTVKFTKKIPKELQNFTEEFDALRKVKHLLHTEDKLAFDKDWKPVTFFDKSVRYRCVIDCHYPSDGDSICIDYKTGKIRKEDTQQLSMYAMALFLTTPAKVVDGSLWYLDQGEAVPASFKRSELPQLKAYWTKRFAPMFKDQRFKATPNRLCGWCSFSKSKGLVDKDGKPLCEF